MTVADSHAQGDTTLRRNPFHLLGATTRDGRARIIELAEERALVADEDACREAQNTLVNLRNRLAAEMGWFPGVSPRKASEIADGIAGPTLPATAGDLPPLARANALAAHLECLPPRSEPARVGPIILKLAAAVEEVDPDGVFRDINEDRAVAGYQPVRDADLVVAEFEVRKRDYRNAVRDYADGLPSRALVKLIDRLVELGTDDGQRHAPAVIQDLVDLYESAAQGFVEREAENVAALVERARAAVPYGQDKVAKVVDDVERAALNFNVVLKPVQTVNLVNGTAHGPSLRVAYTIRDLAIELHNEHGWHALPARITSFLETNFPRLGDIQHQVAMDAKHLKDEAEQRRVAEAEKREFEESLKYEADLGTFFKDRVSMNAQAIEWRNQRFPLDAVTRMRWGSTRHSVNGVPTGTSHVIVVGDATSSMTIKLSSPTVFDGLTDRLWKAVGVRLLVEHVRRLREGGTVAIPGGAIRDDGAVLTRRKLFGKDEVVLVPWNGLHVWSENGNFVIAKRDETKVQAVLSYQNNDNTQVIENLIRAAFKNGKARISELLS